MSQLFGHLSREFWRDIGSKSRDVFELILPPADVFEDGSDLVVMVDMPGFEKDRIKTRLTESMLAISAKREQVERDGITYWEQRPLRISKRIQLPVKVDTSEDVETKATYAEGVLTVRLPIKGISRIRVE
jgi:HSP20 family molecular chaperone IbpA